jgi:hypothetical protein
MPRKTSQIPYGMSMPLEGFQKTADETKKRMERAAKDLDFMEAARSAR